jgi:hypothetical protein
MNSTKDVTLRVFARHPRPWKLSADGDYCFDADGKEVILVADEEDTALLFASIEALNRLDPADLGADVEPEGEVV